MSDILEHIYGILGDDASDHHIADMIFKWQDPPEPIGRTFTYLSKARGLLIQKSNSIHDDSLDKMIGVVDRILTELSIEGVEEIDNEEENLADIEDLIKEFINLQEAKEIPAP